MDKTISSLPGYQVKNLIYESLDSLIYRGRRTLDGQPVILKLLKEPYPSPEKVPWFKREYELTRSLKLPGVIWLRPGTGTPAGGPPPKSMIWVESILICKIWPPRRKAGLK